MTLTDITIGKAKTRERPYKVSDGGGLYLWVTPAGDKHCRWTYRHEGKQKLMTFGKYPDVPLVLARERHSEARRLLATGTDPMAQRKADKITLRSTAQDSFCVIAGQWFDHWKVEKSAQHVDATRRRMDANIFLLGTRPITEIEAPELVAMVKAIEARRFQLPPDPLPLLSQHLAGLVSVILRSAQCLAVLIRSCRLDQYPSGRKGRARQ
jgi:hypothetical protein